MRTQQAKEESITASAAQAEAGTIRKSDMATGTSNAAAKPSANLSGYVGKYPGDKVDGQRFLDNPLVKAAIQSALRNAEFASIKPRSRSSRMTFLPPDGLRLQGKAS